MPPLTHSCYDIMEAREWAGSTMESFLSKEQSLEMDSAFYIAPGKYRHLPQQPDQKQLGPENDSAMKPRRASVLPHRLQRFNQIRRSFSVLDGDSYKNSPKPNESTQHHNGSNQYRLAHSPPQSICSDDDSTSAPILTCLASSTQSAPVSPTEVSRRPSFSTRIIRKTFDMTSLFITTLDRQRKDSQEKEREALALWQHTFEQSLLAPSTSSTSNSALSNVQSPTTTNLTLSTTQNSKCKSSKYTRFIMMELLSTEENYLDDLYIIKTKFMDPLVKASQQSQPIINHRDIRTIFAFIPQLLLLSATFVRNLRSAIDDSDQTYCDDDENNGEQDPCKIVGHVIYELESSFDVFIYYSLNFKKSRKCLNKLDCDALCHQLLHDPTIWRKETKRMNLSDFLITPIQRITRYCLILKDLQKHSPADVLLDRSIKCLSSLAFTMNEIQ